MSKPKSSEQPAPVPAPIIMVVLPDEIARQIHRQLTQLDDFEPAPPRLRRSSRGHVDPDSTTA